MLFKIGVLGSGDVGKTLAYGLRGLGYEVCLGSRTPAKLEERKTEIGFGGILGTFEEAAEFGDVLILAVKGSIAENALSLAKKENLKGKVILDTTNPIDDVQPEDGVVQFFTSMNFSLMERLQNQFSQSHFVKCFSCIGHDQMIHPDFNGERPSMFICGNDQEAKAIAASIAERCGFDVEDMGTAKSAGAIESLCILWCIPGFRNNERNHAFKLLKKHTPPQQQENS